MMILSRRPNESIKIGDNIDVVVARIDGDEVKIGIEAGKKIESDLEAREKENKTLAAPETSEAE